MQGTGTTSAKTHDGEQNVPRNSQMISRRTLRRVAIVAGLMLVAFLAGYIPAWLSANGYEYERDRLREELRAAEMRHHLAAAALSAENGRYDEALPAASRFFDELRSETNSAEGNFDASAMERFTEMLTRRDEVIANLARGDASANETLAAWFFEFEKLARTGSEDQLQGS